MAYEKKSIRIIIDNINKRYIYIPAIQRKYIWNDLQITKLMDSIMLGYPIGTFLFWKVKKTIVNQKEYSMYEFIKEYHDRDNNINPPAPKPIIGNDDETIWAVLDGQQRLTSLYIALQGSISRKIPYKKWKNDNAFPKKELYFNLQSKDIDNEDISYEFKFLTLEEVNKNKNNKTWYRVKDILKYSTNEDLEKEVIIPNGWIEDNIAKNNIFLLYRRLVTDEIIIIFSI